MRLNSIANVVPDSVYTQLECWEILKKSNAIGKLKTRSISILEKILNNEDNGIDKRHLAVPGLEKIPFQDAEFLNNEFRREAPRLAERALRLALEKAGLVSTDLDALLICTCTGYLCPGLSSYVAESLGIRGNAYLQDLVGLGCGAAIPTLRSADYLIRANPDMRVACIAVEICSAAFYLDDDPGVLISLCLFGDGASASIWSASNGDAGIHVSDFDTLHVPENRELLRFVNCQGKLKNKLHKSVPGEAAAAVEKLFANLEGEPIERIIAHAGGRDVVQALKQSFPEQAFRETSEVLKHYGNMSSPSVLFALEKMLEAPKRPQNAWLTSFGAGFSAHSLRLKTNA